MNPDGPVLAYADGCDSARSSPAAVLAAAGRRHETGELLLGWTPEDRPWLADADLRGRTLMAGYALLDAVTDGRLAYLPVRLSAVPRLLAGQLRPQVAVVSGVRRRAEVAFGVSAGWGPAVARAAERVVVEVDPNGRDVGAPLVPGNVVATIERPGALGPVPLPRPPNDTDRRIAAYVVDLLPEEPTLQVGPGGVAEAVMASLCRPVHVWSGLVTDALAEVHRRHLLLDNAVAAYAWGGERVAALASEGTLRLAPLEHTHDLTALSGIERFVACNTALQVGLDGSVNVERVSGRPVAGIGGHPDFCIAASRSPGGLSVIALAATTRAGASTIVPQVEVVSTARSDVEVVVTEHGVADLRGVDDAERARRITAVAAPEHRDWLASAARSLSRRPVPQEVS
jgi:acyl-CoA hydrolase